MKKTTSMLISPKMLQISDELDELQYLMPIGKEDRKNLEEDIEKNGVRDPIKVYQNLEGEFFVIGGFNRWEIANNLELDQIPIDIYNGTTDEIKELVINDNLVRRHLTTEQKRKIAGFLLSQNPGQSNRAIAEQVKVDPKTIAKVRIEKEEKGEIEPVNATVGRDGVERKKVEKKAPTGIKKTSNSICPHCGGVI
jgi:hypothetical protein